MAKVLPLPSELSMTLYAHISANTDNAKAFHVADTGTDGLVRDYLVTILRGRDDIGASHE